MRSVDKFDIPIEYSGGSIRLEVVPTSDKDKMSEVEGSDTDLALEAHHQLQESGTYHYYFYPDIYQFRNDKASNIIFPSTTKGHLGEGTIKTGIYVGTLTLDIVERSNPDEPVATVDFEVQSLKMNYRQDYRIMLEDITNDYVELIMAQGSPVNQQFEVDLDNTNPQTLYQRFAFVKSFVESEEFALAINKIQHNPVKRWTDTTVRRPITGVKRLNRQGLRQIASRPNRISINPQDFGFPEYVTSIPQSLEVPYRKDTTDVAENQFVKYVLNCFTQFCSSLYQRSSASQRLQVEARQTENLLIRMLSTPFFRDISLPSMISFNSPVLQRKEGYREVMQAWLFFDLSAKLTWTGGDNVYRAGKRNVAALYEYWLFFKLKKVIADYFQITPKSLSSLIKTDDDGINLELSQGKMQVIEGVYHNSFRDLHVEFYYNKTFNYDDQPDNQGSWTIQMRPDYTLAIWPKDLDRELAERENLLVYIHFDAKYRLRELLTKTKTEEEINAEKEEEALNTYKQGDILKMHAYMDAIRRTSGAYVLYPGTETRDFKGFHEVIPGLGAFAVRPGDDNSTDELRKFIQKVVHHLLNRSSMRERMATHDYLVYQAERDDVRNLRVRLPEAQGENRDFVPDETTVIIGYCKNSQHRDWICQNYKYNCRAGERKGSLKITTQLASARYLLLHDDNGFGPFFKIAKGGPSILSRRDLIANGYPATYSRKDDDIYLVYSLENAEEDFSAYEWDGLDIPHNRSVQYISLTDLMLKVKKDNLFQPHQ